MGKKIYLLLVATHCASDYVVHSAHTDKRVAHSWGKRQVYEGGAYEVWEMPVRVVGEVVELAGAKFPPVASGKEDPFFKPTMVPVGSTEGPP